MSRYYEKEYDMMAEIENAEKSILFYESKITEFNGFIQEVVNQNISIPEDIHRDIKNKLANFKLYINKRKEIIEEANQLIAQGKRYIDCDEWKGGY